MAWLCACFQNLLGAVKTKEKLRILAIFHYFPIRLWYF